MRFLPAIFALLPLVAHSNSKDLKRGKGSSKSASPSAPPSNVPSAYPSAPPTRRLLLCEDSESEAFSDATVEDLTTALVAVKETINAVLLRDSTEVVFEEFKSSAESLRQNGATIATVALALTKSYPSLSEPSVTQSLVIPDLQALNEDIGTVAAQTESYAGTEFMRRYIGEASSLIDMNMARLENMKRAYIGFVNTRTSVNEGTKSKATLEFQTNCNVPQYNPLEIFHYFYGFACGNAGMERTCEDDGPNDTGVCDFGLKTQNYFMRYFMNADNERLPSNISTFRAFSFWIMSAMLEAMFMFSVCVAPDVNTCEFVTFADRKNTILLEMQDAFSEVIGNMGRIEECIDIAQVTRSNSNRIANASTNRIEICRKDLSGNVVPPTDFGYYFAAEPVPASITEAMVDELTTDVLTTLASIAEIGGGILDGTQIGTALQAAGGVLNVATFFLGKEETDATQTLIINKFSELREELNVVSEKIQDGFLNIQTSITDAQFDNLMGRLASIDKAHERFMDAFDDSSALTESESLFVKNKYAQEFRASCNVPHFKPEDIFRRLYGYVCGDNISKRGCRTAPGAEVGKCVFGPMNRDYALDDFRMLDVTNPGLIVEFGNWLITAMIQAYSLHLLCLNPDANACTDTSADPIFDATSVAMKDALAEISSNLQVSAGCLCRCKRIELAGFEVVDSALISGDTAAVVSFKINGLPVRDNSGIGEVKACSFEDAGGVVFTIDWTDYPAMRMIDPMSNFNIVYSKGGTDYSVSVEELNGLPCFASPIVTTSKTFQPNEYGYDERCLTAGDPGAIGDGDDVYIESTLTLEDGKTKVTVRLYDEEDTSKCD